MSRRAVLQDLQPAIRSALLPWFKRHARDLPWRRRRTAYTVWVSEMMLQQTRVDQALPYYRRWMKRFPSLKALAEAPRRDVLKCWEGLGYYARARRMHETAQVVRKQHRGRFPRTYEGLLALPGVGPYSAAAMASLAFGLDHAVLDGNVIRVLSRLLAYGGDVATPRARRQLQAWATQLMPPGRAGECNEALMELGATVCLPRQPACPRCPLRKTCAAFAQNRATAYPRKDRKPRVPHKQVGAAVVVRADGRLLIAQRREESMLGGLWEFPGGTREPGETMEACIARELQEELGTEVEVGRHLVTIKHTYSHFSMDLHVHWAKLRKGRPRAIECADFAWVRVKDLEAYPFSKADLRVVELLKEGATPGG